jgi:hypothetical protein
MSLRFVSAVLLAVATAASPAFACKGPNLQFSDDFKTEDPGWQPYGAWVTFSIGGGKIQVKSDPGSFAAATYQGFFMDSGDACVDVYAPDVKDPASVIGGFMFGGVGTDFYAFVLRPNGNASLFRRENGGWLTPVGEKKADGAKTGANAVNTLRVSWKDTSGQAWVNDKLFANFKIKSIKNGKFGVYSEPEGNTYQFGNVKITDVP